MSQSIDELIDYLQSAKTITFDCTNRVDNEYNYNEILEFWFGSNGDDWTENLRNKWFVSSNSKQQFELDDYIKNKYNSLLNSLLNNKNNLLQKWKRINSHSCLAAIIVLDQFSRHIYRNEINKYSKGERIMIDKCDIIALELSKYIISNNKNNNRNNLLSSTFTVPQFIFCLMPFRHSKELNNIEFVLSQIDNNFNKNQILFSELITRFKRGTIKQLQGIQSINNELKLNDNENFDDILQFNGFDYKYKQENKQENNEEKTMKKSKRKWKKVNNNNNNDCDIIINNKLYKTIKLYLEARNISKLKYLFVSLSGGVDSMVITQILYFLKLFNKT
eukprot:117867_1